jgi:hypothetical protein
MREGFLWEKEGYSLTPHNSRLRCLCNSEVLLASYTRQFSCTSKNCNHFRFGKNKALPEIFGDRQPCANVFFRSDDGT